MSGSEQNLDEIAKLYRKRHDEALVQVAKNLEEHIRGCLASKKRIDRISARAKDVDRFVKKAGTLVDGARKYTDPLSQVQDQVGARIVVFYKSDVEKIDEAVLRYFTAIESRQVVPDSEAEFSYFGRHHILAMPNDVVDAGMDKSLIPNFFELQIKTLFQHAWSEADHDLAYKPGEVDLNSEQRRLVAFTSAQAWGADHIFDQLFRELSPV